MDEDDRPRPGPGHEIGMELDSISIDELNERVALLEAEIARLKAAIAERERSRAAAAAFFKK